MKKQPQEYRPQPPHPDDLLRQVLAEKATHKIVAPPPSPPRRFASDDVVSAQTHISARSPGLSRAERDAKAAALRRH